MIKQSKNLLCGITVFLFLVSVSFSQSDQLPDSTKERYKNHEQSKILYRRALKKIEAQKYLDAYDELTRSIKLNADFSAAYLKRAEVQIQLCMFEAAIKDYARGEKISPADYRFSLGRANIFLTQGDFKNSSVELAKAKSIYKKAKEKADSEDKRKSFYFSGRSPERDLETLEKKLNDAKENKTRYTYPCQKETERESPFLKKNKGNPPFTKKKTNL